MTALLVLLLVLALFGAAFCAGAETGFSAVNRGRVLHLVRAGSARAKILQRILADLPRTITTLLVGNNLAAVVYSAVSAALSERVFPSSPGARAVWGAAAACLILYAGEFMPKLFCSARPLRRMLLLAPVYRAVAWLLAPVAHLALWVTGFFVPAPSRREKVTIANLERILTDRKDGVKLTDFESALIGRILVLRKKGREITPDALLKALEDA